MYYTKSKQMKIYKHEPHGHKSPSRYKTTQTKYVVHSKSNARYSFKKNSVFILLFCYL
jgi:hypothetical protein